MWYKSFWCLALVVMSIPMFGCAKEAYIQTACDVDANGKYVAISLAENGVVSNTVPLRFFSFQRDGMVMQVEPMEYAPEWSQIRMVRYASDPDGKRGLLTFEIYNDRGSSYTQPAGVITAACWQSIQDFVHAKHIETDLVTAAPSVESSAGTSEPKMPQPSHHALPYRTVIVAQNQLLTLRRAVGTPVVKGLSAYIILDSHGRKVADFAVTAGGDVIVEDYGAYYSILRSDRPHGIGGENDYCPCHTETLPVAGAALTLTTIIGIDPTTNRAVLVGISVCSTKTKLATELFFRKTVR